MIVFLAGMQRSGSTFAFNVARDVLRKRGSLYQEFAAEIVPQVLAAGNSQQVLLKAHQMDSLGSDLRAVAQFASSARFVALRMPLPHAETFGSSEENAIASIREWMSLYAQLKYVALSLDYNLIDRYPVLAAHRIDRFLYHDVSWAEAWCSAHCHSKLRVKEIADGLRRCDARVKDVGCSYYDRATFFHRRHVSSLKSRSASQRLPPDQVQRIRSALGADAAILRKRPTNTTGLVA